jgi:hypothetical protein
MQTRLFQIKSWKFRLWFSHFDKLSIPCSQFTSFQTWKSWWILLQIERI